MNHIQVSKEVAFSSQGSVAGSITSDAQTAIVDTNPISEQQEMQNLRQIIVTWRALEGEVSELGAQLREKRKRMKALEEENRQLKRLVADQALNLQVVKDLLGKKW